MLLKTDNTMLRVKSCSGHWRSGYKKRNAVINDGISPQNKIDNNVINYGIYYYYSMFSIS